MISLKPIGDKWNILAVILGPSLLSSLNFSSLSIKGDEDTIYRFITKEEKRYMFIYVYVYMSIYITSFDIQYGAEQPGRMKNPSKTP